VVRGLFVRYCVAGTSHDRLEFLSGCNGHSNPGINIIVFNQVLTHSRQQKIAGMVRFLEERLQEFRAAGCYREKELLINTAGRGVLRQGAGIILCTA
jgi:hypothetical protein